MNYNLDSQFNNKNSFTPRTATEKEVFPGVFKVTLSDFNNLWGGGGEVISLKITYWGCTNVVLIIFRRNDSTDRGDLDFHRPWTHNIFQLETLQATNSILHLYNSKLILLYDFRILNSALYSSGYNTKIIAKNVILWLGHLFQSRFKSVILPTAKIKHFVSL